MALTVSYRPYHKGLSLVVPPLGYARRTLAHGLAPYDWEWALDFAEGVWGK